MQLCFQGFIDEAHAGNCWQYLREHPAAIKQPDRQIDGPAITTLHDSYARPIVETSCGREMMCNAVRTERQGCGGPIVGHFRQGPTGITEECLSNPTNSNVELR